MNNTFDIKRLGLLLQNDLKECLFKLKSKMGALFVLYIGIILYAWVRGLIYGDTNMVEISTRFLIIFLMTIAVIISAPAVLYGHVNSKNCGIDYTMLPVSSIEKILSMVIMSTLLAPALCLISLLMIDTAMSYLPLSGGAISNIFTSDLGSTAIVKEIGSLVPTTSGVFLISESIQDLLWLSSFALLGNMIFKSNKVSKTILSLIVFSILLISIVILVFKIAYSMDITMEAGSILVWMEKLSPIYLAPLSIGSYLFSSLLLYFTYRRIKKQQY